MLDKFRTWSQSFVAKILLGLLIFSFGVWGISGVAGGAFEMALRITGFGPKDLAKVGSVTINGDDYAQTLQRQLQQVSGQAGRQVTLEEARKAGLPTQVLDMMVGRAAIAAQIGKLGLVPPAGQPASVLGGAVIDTAANQLALPKTLTEALAQYQGESRDVKYFDVTATEADVAKPADADIDAQYKKAAAAYTAPEYRTVAVMSVDAKTLSAAETATDAEIAAAYDQHKNEMGTPETRTIIQLPFTTLEAAKAAKAQLASGTDLAKVAEGLGKKIEDMTFADKLQKDFIDPKVGAAAFALKEGDVSEPVKGDLATVLLKAVKVTKANVPTLDQVKPKLAEDIKLQKAQAKVQSIYNDVEDARAKGTKFEDIAKAQNLAFTLTAPISATGLGQDDKPLPKPLPPEILKAVFNSDVGVENDAIGGQDGYTWYDVRSVVPSALKPLDQVKPQVIKDITSSRIREAASAKASKIADAIKAGKTIDAAASEAGAAIRTAQGLKRNQQTPSFDGPANAAAFSVNENGVATSALGDGKSARIMQVIKTTLPVAGASNPELDELKKQLAANFNYDMQFDLVAALKKSVGVKINSDLWKQNNGGEEPPVE